MLKEIRLKDNEMDNGEVDVYTNSYYVNTEHITYFCTQGGDIAVHFVGGDCLILEGYGDLPSIAAFSEFMQSDSKFFDFTKLPHT